MNLWTKLKKRLLYRSRWNAALDFHRIRLMIWLSQDPPRSEHVRDRWWRHRARLSRVRKLF